MRCVGHITCSRRRNAAMSPIGGDATPGVIARKQATRAIAVDQSPIAINPSGERG